MIQAHRAYNDPLESGQHSYCWSAESFPGETGISMPSGAAYSLATPSPLEVPSVYLLLERLQPEHLQPVWLPPDIPMPCRNQQLVGRAV